MVNGLYKLLLSNCNEPVNIGNPHEITLNELAQNIINLAKSKSKIIYKPLPTDDPKVRRPDITKARKILKWEPKINLEEGLKQTIQYFKLSNKSRIKK
jgi:dTDP-glucose 4,6-dehydratase